jgi:hypothetical protein
VRQRWIVIGVVVGLLACVLVLAALGAAAWLWWRSTPASPLMEPPVPGLATRAPDAPTATPYVPASLEEQMAHIEGLVIELRGLQPDHDVEKFMFSEEELRERVESDWLEDYTPEEARIDTLTWAAFDLIPPDTDLYDLYLDLYTEQVAGFYDSEIEEIYIVSPDAERLSAIEEATYAHEYDHLLQDQTYDLDALLPADDDEWYEAHPDESRARLALIEGDAVLAEQIYLFEYFTPEQMQEMIEEYDTFEFPVLDNAPEIVQRDLFFPYDAGLDFVTEVFGQGGWEAVDQVWADPPRSTEQVMHPERYFEGDEPQPVSLEPIGDALPGWELIREQPFGEFMLLVYLEQHLSASHAASLAEGWGGDFYAVYHNPDDDRLAFVLRVVWDDSDEADEFFKGFQDFGNEWAGGEASVEAEGLTCWQAADTLCVALDGTDSVVVRAPDQAAADSMLAPYALGVAVP